jgi:nicotinate-nucleotide pyrophosphorylase (carboxylating)
LEELKGAIRELAERALEEDAAARDLTTNLLVDSNLVGAASITAKAPGVISGQEAAEVVFELIDGSLEYTPVVENGSRVIPGGVVSRVRGSAAAILSGERTALNFLQHLSGIATLTARFVKAVEGTGVKLLDTRKTTPGLRILEKRAVVHGGGINHRFDLEERVLVKENHLTVVGGIDAVLAKLEPDVLKNAEIEISSIDELLMLRASPPGRVLLDNFSPGMLTAALNELKSWGGDAPEVEVSGGVGLESIGDYAAYGVDFISVGSLTSSAPVLDLSLNLEEVWKP